MYRQTGRTCFLAFAMWALIASCSASDDGAIVRDPSFDNWCAGELCDWTGSGVARTYTWHKQDLAVSLLARGSNISQLLTSGAERCFLFDTIVDVDPMAMLTLQLDFNDDGTPDFEQQLVGTSWKSVLVAVPAPIAYESVRFIVLKKGDGRAVLAQLRAVATDECAGEPTRLHDGSSCSSNEVCETGHVCVDGKCNTLTPLRRPE